MPRHFVRLPPKHESNPHKLIEFCSGCATTLHSTGALLISDRTYEGNPLGIVIYDIKDPSVLAKISEETPSGLHHLVRED